jgi:hypothetical protein
MNEISFDVKKKKNIAMGYVVFQVIENQVRHGLHFGKWS